MFALQAVVHLRARYDARADQENKAKNRETASGHLLPISLFAAAAPEARFPMGFI
jgi:hypothetical protein